MPINTLFIQKNCDRCGRELGESEKRFMSFFTREVICALCHSEEDEIRKKIKEQDGDPSADLRYQGIGVVPKVK